LGKGLVVAECILKVFVLIAFAGLCRRGPLGGARFETKPRTDLTYDINQWCSPDVCT